MKQYQGLIACWVLLPVIMFTCGSAWSANLVTNGDFENGLAGWVFTPTEDAEPLIFPTTVPYSTSNAFRVNPGREIWKTTDEGGVLSQPINLLFGLNYDVSIGLLAIEELHGNPNADGGTIEVFLDGVSLHTFDHGYTDPYSSTTDSFSTTFHATSSGLADLEIRLTRPYRNAGSVIFHFVDDIEIEIAFVPEPARATLILIGGGLAILTRRRTI